MSEHGETRIPVRGDGGSIGDWISGYSRAEPTIRELSTPVDYPVARDGIVAGPDGLAWFRVDDEGAPQDG